MPDTSNTPIILTDEGFKAGDVSSFISFVPSQSVAGLDVCKDPVAGAWIALTAYPNFDKLGYLTGKNKLTGVKIRLVTTDHPDGG